MTVEQTDDPLTYMNVRAIFETEYTGELIGAAWIVESPSNRRRFKRCKGLHPNSALFSLTNYENLLVAVPHVLWGICDHFPALETISVSGIELDPKIVENLRRSFDFDLTDFGFSCRLKGDQV